MNKQVWILIGLIALFLLINPSFSLATNSTNSSNSTLSPDLQSPTISFNVSNNVIFNSLDVVIGLTIQDNVALSECNYIIDNSNPINLDCSTTSLQLSLNEGQHHLEVFAKDTSNNTASKSLSFTIDITPPSIVSYYPTQRLFETKNVEIGLTTSEEAICKFDFYNKPFSSMSYSFSTTDNLFHTYQLSLEEGLYNISILCKDLAGNVMVDSLSIPIEINLKPYIERIVIENAILDGDTYLLKPGFYELTIELSEPVASLDLYYTLQTSFTKNKVNLVGSGKDWKGYFMIPSSSSDNVGSFQASIRDMSGKEGNEIKEGKVFIIDATPPKEVSDFKIKEITSNTITLAWHYSYSLNDVAKFNIYRSTSPDVSYVDFYTSVSKDTNTFKDTNLDENQTYYYRIAAVDKAGNEGPLSEELSAKLIVAKEESNSVDVKTSDTKPPKELIDLKSLVEQKLMEVQWVMREFQSIQDKEKNEIFNILNLKQTIESVDKNLKLLQNQINDLLDSPSNSGNYDLIAKSLESKIKMYASSLPKELVIEDKQELLEDLSSSDVEYISNLIVNRYPSLDEKLKKKYVDDNLALLEHLKIIAIYYLVKVKTMDESEKYFVVVKKKVISKEPLRDVQIVEDLDPSFTDSISSVNFKDEPKILSDSELIVAKDFQNFNEYEFIYWVEGNKISEAKLSRTYLLKNPSYLEQELINKDSKISGMATFNVTSFSLDSLIIVLFVAILLLGAYYYTVTKSSKNESTIFRGAEEKLSASLADKTFAVASFVETPDFLLEKASQSLIPINKFNFNYARNLANKALNSMSAKEKVAKREKLAYFKSKFDIANKVLMAHELVDKKDHIFLSVVVRELENALEDFISKMDFEKDKEFVKEVKKHIKYFKQVLDLIDPVTSQG